MCRAVQDMGKRYGDPQTIAALRLGSMYEHGLVPYIGVNTTEALEFYQEACFVLLFGGAVGGSTPSRFIKKNNNLLYLVPSDNLCCATLGEAWWTY